jgi:competence protein ComEA
MIQSSPDVAPQRLAALTTTIRTDSDGRADLHPAEVSTRQARPGWRARLAQRWFTGAGGTPGPVAATALAGLAAVVIFVAVLAWWPTRGVESVPVLAAVSAPVVATPSVPAISTSEVVVSVVGRVGRPGLVTLAPGGRVADAVRAAGDLLPDTDLRSVNLARRLRDGEQVLVGVPGGENPADVAESGHGPTAKINLNTATAEKLDELPGIGKVTATRIVQWRDKHGGFRTVDQLREIEGIGATRLGKLRDLVTV